MTLARLVRFHESHIEVGFEQAIRFAVHEAIRRSKPVLPQEPDFVAMLVLEAVPYIGATLSALLGGYGVEVKVAGVFCHQKPVVRYSGAPVGCELGDLLLVHRHVTPSGENVNRSLLLQAKVGSGGHIKLGPSDSVQLQLYVGWPGFSYQRAGALNGASRNVLPKACHAGAQYLLIDDLSLGIASSGLLGLPGTHCMAVSPAGAVLTAGTSLAHELVRTLDGSSGRGFYDDAAADHSGWSQVVWDLIRLAHVSTFRRSRIGIKASRHSGDDSFTTPELHGASIAWAQGSSGGDNAISLIANILDGSSLPPMSVADALDADEARGASLVVIETRNRADG